MVLTKGSTSVFALHRTGALPVSYLPEGQTGIEDILEASTSEEDANQREKYEQEGYDFFSDSGDAALARVVQYTALYQIFRHFGVTTAPLLETDYPSGYSEMQGVLVSAFERLRTVETAELVESYARSLYQGLDEDEKLAAEFTAVLAVAKAEALVLGIYEAMGDHGIEQLAGMLADPRNVEIDESVLESAMKKIANADLDQLDELTQDPDIRQAYLLFLTNAAMAQPALRSVIVDQVDKEEIKGKFVRSMQRRDSGWLRTPSVVISSTTGELASLTGGHNLDSRILRLSSNPNVTKGTARIVDVEGGKRIAEVNPSDMARASELVRPVSRAAGAKQAAASARRILGKTPPPPRPPHVALYNGTPPSGPRGYKPEHKTIGWRRTAEGVNAAKRDKLRALNQAHGPGVLLESKDGVHRVYDQNPLGPIRADSRQALVDTLIDKMRRQPESAHTLQLHLNGLKDHEIGALVDTFKIRLASTGAPRKKGIGFVTGGSAPRWRKRLAADYDFAKAEVGAPRIEQLTRHGKPITRVTFEVVIPPRRGGLSALVAKVNVFVRSVTNGLQERVRSAFNRVDPNSKQRGDELLFDLQKELERSDVNIEKVQIEMDHLLVADNWNLGPAPIDEFEEPTPREPERQAA